MIPRPPRRPWSMVAAIGLLAATTGCGRGADTTTACGPITREPLDPAFLTHVLGDGSDVRYLSDPPTSGPHTPGPAIEGAVDAPLTRPEQVGILERGDVLLQYRPDLPTAELTALQALGGRGVVIAPNADLSARIVATAWTAKRTCSAADAEGLREFVELRRGKGPDS